MTVGGHDPADDPTGEWLALRPVIKSRLSDPRVRQRLEAKYTVFHGYDVPYVCGMSVDWDGFFVDQEFHKAYPLDAAPVGKGGAIFDVTRFVWLHECGEMAFIEFWGDFYLFAHKLITIAEHDEAVEAGIDWRRYVRFFDSYDRSTEGEKLRRVSRKLYMRPYRDEGDWLLINQMQAVMV